MRISDWSSDVCSSDLRSTCPLYEGATLYFSLNCQRTLFGQAAKRPVFPVLELGLKINHSLRKQQDGVARSEEHTSELQSLMRISYAVFRLKKKIKSTKVNQSNNNQHNPKSEQQL